MLGKEDAVWDALQEVWLRAFQKIRSLRDPHLLGAWLYRIAHNVAMTQLRKAPNWESLDDEEGEEIANASALATESEVPEACAAADLHWALDRRSPHARIIRKVG